MLKEVAVATLGVRCGLWLLLYMWYACDGLVGPTYGASGMRIGPSDVTLVVLLRLGASDDSLGGAADWWFSGPMLPSCRSAKLSPFAGFVVEDSCGDLGRGIFAGSIDGEGGGDILSWFWATDGGRKPSATGTSSNPYIP